MEAFKLLSRSTNLKSGRNSHAERKAAHLPSEGQLPASISVPREKLLILSERTVAGQKRKSDVPHSASSEEKAPTPVGLNGSTVGQTSREDKFEGISYEQPTQTVSASRTVEDSGKLSLDERRSIFRSHKVKIATLTGHQSSAMPNDAKTLKAGKKRKSARVEPLTRKKQKEASRLYTQPLTSFASLNTLYKAPRTLLSNITEQGYMNPTEVQLATLPLLLDPTAAGIELPPNCSSIDLLTIAPTGSGKTVAYLIPLISHLIHDHHHHSAASKSPRHMSALVIAPTKELVSHIVNEGRKLCRNTGVSVTAMRKGMQVGLQSIGSVAENSGEEDQTTKDLGTATTIKADILVTTPLLLANTISEGKGDLSATRHLILDEADILLDPLFRDQTIALWNACTNHSLHIRLWSATIGSNIEQFVVQLLNERQDRLGIRNRSPFLRCIIGLKDSALPTISHKLIYAATEPGKLLGLRQLLHPSATLDGSHTAPPLRPPFLVFTQTIERAVALHAELLYDIPTEAGGSSRIAVLHSDLSDSKRSDIMARFRKGQIWVLITTDLLSRGVDFRGVNGVVNYDIPTSSAAYVHRVGRTGRAGREGGMAVTFYIREDVKYVKAIANAIAASEKARGKANGEHEGDGVQPWLLHALPNISKKDRHELKRRGVEVRRKLRTGESDKEARAKRNARISTKSGYTRRLENKRKGAIAGCQGRHDNGTEDGQSDGWSGFDG